MSGEEKEKISFDNFNYQLKGGRLTSPLSIQACKLNGVTEEDIIYLTFEDYIRSHPESMNLPKEFQQERYDNYEQNRKDLIESLKENRNKLIESLSKQEKTEKADTEDYFDEFNSTKRKTYSINKDDLRKKLKDDLEYNIKIQIENEFEKKKKKTKKDEEGGMSSKNIKKMNRSMNEKEKLKTDVKLKNEINNINRINRLDKKQKEYLEKEEKRKKHIEDMRNELNKKRNQEYQLKKTKVKCTLTQNEEKMKEKLLTFYKKKQEREERIEKREKERLDELNKKYKEDNKKNSDRLKAAILKNEELKHKKYEKYNKKLNNFIESQKKKEDKEKEKQIKKKAIKDLKDSQVIQKKIDIKNKEDLEKIKYFYKQEKMEERLKMVKEDKEKEKMIKFNKLYISENNLRIRHMREENAKEYKKNLWLQNMDQKRQLIKEKKEKENEENAQKRLIRDEINKDKLAMMERLKDIMQTGEEYTKDEVNEYVLNGKKPKPKKKEINKTKTINKDDNQVNENKGKDDEYGGEEAFITSVPEK